MQEKIYTNTSNKLVVVKKPINISSNAYLNKIKRKYKNKKAGFSGTLDPFACGCLIVAFGQYSKLFKYFEKTPKVYRAVLWLGAQSNSLDMENIQNIFNEKRLNEDIIKDEILKLKGIHHYYPPKFSAKKIQGKRAYSLSREGKDFELKQISMEVYESSFISYNHPFICFEAKVSEGSYIRSLAQILLKRLFCKGTLSYLERLSEGKFCYENEKDLNPLDFLTCKENKYFGDISYFINGKKIDIRYLKEQKEGIYFILFDEFFSIVEIKNDEVKYLLNKVSLC